MSSAHDWIAEFAERLGTEPPTEQEFNELLALAGVAAHASERVAAPVSCWVTARAGVTPGDALAAAKQVASRDGDA